MLLFVFGKSLFLQSLGWGIANSLWQAALLWTIYIMITAGDKNLSALFRHHLSLILHFGSFVWFIFTVVQNYLFAQYEGNSNSTAGWLYIPANIHAALQGLSLLYIGLLVPYSMHFIKQLAGLHILRNKKLIKASVETRIFTERTALHIGIKRKVAVWLSENVEVPSVIGLLKPVILLPVAVLSQLTAEQAESIILHELAHIKRNDYFLNLLLSFTELALFFNPFVRLLGNIAKKERENCCDDWVLNYQYDKHDYAAALLMLERQRVNPVTLQMTATNGKKILLLRIKRLFLAAPQTNIDITQQIKLLCTSALLLSGSYFLLPVFGKITGTGKVIKKHVFLQARIGVKVWDSYNKVITAKIKSEGAEQVAVLNTETKAKSKHVRISRKEWTPSLITLINEDLFRVKENQNITVPAGNKQSVSYPLLVQVEEESSGVKGKNTYLLQVSNNNGAAEIKPLVYINKKMKLRHRAKIKITAPGKSFAKKRITS